jgi:hypothetical protein
MAPVARGVPGYIIITVFFVFINYVSPNVRAVMSPGRRILVKKVSVCIFITIKQSVLVSSDVCGILTVHACVVGGIYVPTLV